MPRAPRIDFPGARHHVMNRGSRRQQVFYSDADCLLFLEILGDTVARYGVRVHGYALMPNHFHLLVGSVRGNLGDAMRYLGARYGQALNQSRGWEGPVFRGRYKNRVVVRDDHWHYLLAYLHLNAVRARLAGHIDQSQWSSHGAYAGTESAPSWLTRREYLELFGSARAYVAYVRSLSRGRESAPAGVEAVTMASRSSSQQPMTEQERAPPALTPEQALEQVCSLTGASPAQLLTVRSGRQGNAARAIAMWWLVHGAGLNNAQVGQVVRASPGAVSKALSRLRNNPGARSRSWMVDLRSIDWLNGQ